MASIFVSIFLFSNSSFSLIEIPSIHSNVNTFSLVKFQNIFGTLKPTSFFVFSKNSFAADPSNLKSNSRFVISFSKKTTSTSFYLLVFFIVPSTRKAKSIKASISSLKIFFMFGLNIFMAMSFIVPFSFN